MGLFGFGKSKIDKRKNNLKEYFIRSKKKVYIK